MAASTFWRNRYDSLAGCDGHVGESVNEVQAYVTGDVFVVVAAEGYAGDIVAGEAELDTAADVEEFEGG